MLRVLVVDDLPDTVNSLLILLDYHLFEVRGALDGPTALETAGAFHPDVVLLDIGMPGMNGYEVARRLKEGDGKVPVVIAVSARRPEPDRLGPIDLYLEKPVDPGLLVWQLERVREQAGQTGVLRS
jgi:two-component system CheB/CheR fusion protein